jgi:hypothetical protein
LALIVKKQFKMKLKFPKDMPYMFIWGAPGIGKTDVINQVGVDLGIDVQEWHLATIEPTDFIGLPKIITRTTKDGKTQERTAFRLPEIFPDDNGLHDKGGIMFFDELNRANEHVLSASLQLCLNGKVGSYTLPDKWMIVAAGNRREEEPTVTELGTALSNRFKHYNLITSVDEWIKWAQTKEWMDNDVLGFIGSDFGKDLLHYLDPDIESPAWPSPRSWARASKFYHEEKLESNSNSLSEREVKTIFEPEVGNTAATKFASYLKIMNDFGQKDLNLVWTDPDKAKLLPAKLDVNVAVANAIATRKSKWPVDGKKLTKEELENIIKYTVRLKNLESGTNVLRCVRKIHPYVRDEEIYRDIWKKAIIKWYTDHQSILKAVEQD